MTCRYWLITANEQLPLEEAMTRPDREWLRRPIRCTLASVLILAATSLGAAPPPSGAGNKVPRFERDVLPILKEHCLKCHGSQRPKVGLDLRTPRSMRRGSHNGPVLVRGPVEQ